MNLLLVVVVGVSVWLFTVAIHALLLWGFARLFRIGPVSYRRALATWLIIAFVSLLLNLVPLYLLEMAETRSSRTLSMVLASVILAFLVQIGAVWFVVQRLLHAPRWRAAGAGLATLLVGVVFSSILAVGVKAAFFEAFKIPTGAMAPVVIGRHVDVSCSNCDWTYPVGMPDSIDSWTDRERGPSPVTCPNCGQPDEVFINTRRRQGDRILVRKRVLPKRWELAVFRTPEDPTVQFVDRVVGLPGEQVELMGGDVFVNGQCLAKAPHETRDMWLFVHDTAYTPQEPQPNGPRWQPGQAASKWQKTAGGWAFLGSDSGPESLVFTGDITNHLTYNGRESGIPPSQARQVFVGDLMIECPVDQFAGEGSVGFQWEFQGSQVTANVSSTGQVKLVASDRKEEDAEEEGKTRQAQGTLSRPLSSQSLLAFAVRDGHAYVLGDGSPVAQVVVGPQDLASAKEQSTRQASPCRIGITAIRCSLSISHIRLFKDVYYCRAEEMQGPLPEFSNRARLDAESYWMLGDNSQQSKDSRFLGPIREEAITGVPQWIYWPPKRWHEFQ